MPDNAADPAPASGKKAPPAVNPDLVGEELADDAHIWHVYDRVAKEDDERRTKAWDNGLNNLALFAGLFSAVTTAFIIEARQDLEPDYAQMAFVVLNATAFGEKPVHQPFAVAPGARTVNSLWIASLILSLSAALIAIMGKDWIGMYTARPVCNLRQWAEMRTYRLLCIDRWYMSGVIAAAPVLLHVSLFLFVSGLVLFISSDPFTHHLTLGLSLATGILYLVTTLSAVAFSASPFKSPATQMIRAALATFYSYICRLVYRPKCTPLRTPVSQIRVMRAEGTAFLPGGTTESRHRRSGLSHRCSGLWLRCSGLWPAIVKTPGAAIAHVRKIHNWVCSARLNLHWSLLQSHLHAIASAASRVSFDWFLSSIWTDLPSDRRPKLLADALSWLNGASQAPDVFRAIIFALGDLDVGPQVGGHTSLALCTRLRAEIRRTWQQVDFLTFSRYVLADRNTPGKAVLTRAHFVNRFDPSKDSALRCEDGIAAIIRIHNRPFFLEPDRLVNYFPDQVAQPRMHELLLPHLDKSEVYFTDILILLTNRYRKHLVTTDSFSRKLEAILYQALPTFLGERYADTVTVKYGGTTGAIELLTFLCCTGIIKNVTKPAAVELVMELVGLLPIREHRCLAYLFGSGKLSDAAWRKDKDWGWSLYWLSESLKICCVHPFMPSSVCTLSDDNKFDVALARTVVMMLSLQHSTLGPPQHLIEFLFGHLCQSPLPRFSDNDEELDNIRLILENAALLRIVGMPNFSAWDMWVEGWQKSRESARWGIAILAVIISRLGRRLKDPETSHDGTQLFTALAHTEVKGPNGKTYIWDLGEWLRNKVPEILKRSPSFSDAMRDVHDALGTIYPLCEHNSELRVQWDRIGYPGRPGDIFYNPFRDLDLGEFFASAEKPLSRAWIR